MKKFNIYGFHKRKKHEESRKIYSPGAYLFLMIQEHEMHLEEFSIISNISKNDLQDILNDKKIIDYEISEKLSHVFDTSKEFWINLQKNYDKYIEDKERTDCEK